MPRVLFGIDDVNPTFGGVGETHEWRLLDSLLSNYPKIRITHFIPGQYSLKFGKIWGAEKKIRNIFRIKLGMRANPLARLDANLEWCSQFQAYKQFEAGLHGLYHANFIDGSAQEFIGLSQKETDSRLNETIDLFKLCKFAPPKIMAPPGWGVSEELLRALAARDIALAGNFVPPLESKHSGLDLASGTVVQRIRGVRNVPRNISIESFDTRALDNLLEKNAIIGLHGHFRNIGVMNGITAQTISNVVKILEYVEKNNSLHFEFMGDCI